MVNSEDEGRIDYFDGDRNMLRTEHSGYDGDGDDVAAGDNTGDLAEEVIIANDEGGRIDSVDVATDKVHSTDSAYDSDDRLGAGDVTGDGKADVVIANTENNRVDVINFFGRGGNFASAYDSDDRFAVGTFGSGDIDGDGIPDRVELLGIRDGEGEVRFDLRPGRQPVPQGRRGRGRPHDRDRAEPGRAGQRRQDVRRRDRGQAGRQLPVRQRRARPTGMNLIIDQTDPS